MDNDEMNRRLDKLKKKMGISSDEGLAERLSCRYTSILNWRKGKPMSSAFRRILRSLEVQYKSDPPKSNRLRGWGQYSKNRKPKGDLPF
jgi:hypothetical protein